MLHQGCASSLAGLHDGSEHDMLRPKILATFGPQHFLSHDLMPKIASLAPLASSCRRSNARPLCPFLAFLHTARLRIAKNAKRMEWDLAVKAVLLYMCLHCCEEPQH